MQKYSAPVLPGFLAYIAVIATATMPYMWSPELSLVMDSHFWSGLILLAECCFLIGYLYLTRGGSARNVRFSLGLLLVLASALMFSSFEQVAKDAEALRSLFPSEYSNFFLVVELALTYAKNIIAFGIAALGANLAAHSITEP